MKHSFICVKCGSSDVIRLKGSKLSQTSTVPLNRYGRSATLDRYICTRCGYTEQWIQTDEKFLKWVEKNRISADKQSDFI